MSASSALARRGHPRLWRRALFDATETIRKASVERAPRHADGQDGLGDRAALDLGLGKLDLDETLDFVRGFMLFSMLANLAEDRQGIAAEDGADFAAALATLERRRASTEGRDRRSARRMR